MRGKTDLDLKLTYISFSDSSKSQFFLEVGSWDAGLGWQHLLTQFLFSESLSLCGNSHRKDQYPAFFVCLGFFPLKNLLNVLSFHLSAWNLLESSCIHFVISAWTVIFFVNTLFLQFSIFCLCSINSVFTFW